MTRGPLLLCACLGLAALGADAPKDGDLEKLQGTWKVESVEFDGRDDTDYVLGELLMHGKITVADDRLEVRAGDQRLVELTVKLDSKSSPKCVDFQGLKGPLFVADVVEGIYQLDKDAFRVAVYVSGTERQRPGEFKSAANSNVYLFRLKRVK